MTRTEKERARFKARVHTWADRLRVKPNVVRVQRMRRKWASCSAAGWVSFSTRLLRQPRDFQDYVIVHELLHLRVSNHGKLFKSLMRLHLSGEQNPTTGNIGN
ncbi:MAG: M48 family metallopeptidase [Gammaproteobacteria bacterium]